VHRVALLALAVLIVPSSALADEPKPEPWRLGEALGVPGWLTVGLAHRVRLAHLDNDFRGTAPFDATALSLRTLVSAEARSQAVRIGLEFQDARAYLSDNAPVNITIINPVELLQAYVGYAREGLEARLGRITIDLGSRRLVARNRYRNTINGFTGLDVQYASGRHLARGFAVVPVTRLPTEADALRDNRIELDEENTDTGLWGLVYGASDVLSGSSLELFVLGLHQSDNDRHLITPGLRMWRKPAPTRLDFELELAGQIGTAGDLDHRAFFAHAEVGTTLDAPWQPRGALQYDHASGDGDPDDDVSGRFDTLYGARRFDFGPTGIYGSFARSNLVSPGLRVQADPAASVDVFVAYRLYWLASDTDAWTTAGLRDPAGDSGSFLGQQLEARVRWGILPKNLDLDVGAAHLIRGGFAETAAGHDQPVTLVYTQLTGTL
jgi:hypothetical protein